MSQPGRLAANWRSIEVPPGLSGKCCANDQERPEGPLCFHGRPSKLRCSLCYLVERSSRVMALKRASYDAVVSITAG